MRALTAAQCGSRRVNSCSAVTPLAPSRSVSRVAPSNQQCKYMPLAETLSRYGGQPRISVVVGGGTQSSGGSGDPEHVHYCYSSTTGDNCMGGSGRGFGFRHARSRDRSRHAGPYVCSSSTPNPRSLNLLRVTPTDPRRRRGICLPMTTEAGYSVSCYPFRHYTML